MPELRSQRAKRGNDAVARIVDQVKTIRLPDDTERKVSIVRLIILFGLLPILWWNVVSPETEQILIGLTALIASYILVALFIIPRLRRNVRHDLPLTIDMLSITALVWYTGGIQSSLLFLFYLPILSAAIRLDLRDSVLSAVAVSGIVVWLWAVAEGGIPSLSGSTMKVGLLVGSSMVVAVFFSILAGESRLMRERGNLNRLLNNKLDEATEQLRRRLEELEFAYELSRRLAGATGIAPVLVSVAQAAQQLLRAPYAAVFLAEHAGGELVLAHAAGVADHDAMPVMYASAGRVTTDTSHPVTIQVEGPGVWTRAVCTPIVVADRLVGVLCAGGNDVRHPARHSVAVLGHVAGQAGIALDRASMLEDLQRLAVAKPEARLFTRDQFDRILKDEIGRATQLGVPFALLKLVLADLEVGETALDTTAELVQKRFSDVVLGTARRVDIVAQGTRGEFFVLLSMTNLISAQRYAERLLREIKDDATISRLVGTPSGPELRVGIAMFPDDAVGAAQLAYAAQDAAASATADDPVACAHDLESHTSTIYTGRQSDKVQ
ncbi:MAG TPA: GAF domain-containing protein [bacterium]|nr:GAF domain-containing protein [bacterium]